ncbi:MAG: TVP38/TMEM64 family protein [Planctomycetota bacterium]|nr:MAG: TVP38/TMEM64 family protein [Planctomycetota bacterium]
MLDDPVFWRRTIVPYVMAAVAVVVAIVVLGREIHEHLRAMENWIAGLGIWGPIAFVALIVVATSLLVPDTALAIAAGALFGFVVGGIVVVAGGLLAAMVQYALARRLLQGAIQRETARRASLRSIVEAVRRREIGIQVLVRLTPLGPAMVSYLMGAAGVRFGGFMLACLVMIPAFLVEVYFGHAGVHVASMAGRIRGGFDLRDGLLLGGLVAVIVVMGLVGRVARRAIQEAAAKSKAAPGS